MAVQKLHPHDSRQRTDGGEEGAEVGADHRRIERRCGIADVGGHARKEHAHGDVVHQVGGEEGGYAVAPFLGQRGQQLGDAGG